ncbi:lysozyme inhibitor LprI family protein [Pseudomonas sp. BJa5]|uniref:lysozyme inhibitor LprI family protein n=1 Tax=Pseudomonas sp. BJa5 TaxID=2936270 RepID=UPI002559E863|nr:lysozyme inhibitor LprI family protein [Pseudomonas sp. BGr12]MDL2422525.1 lysozyme inhibitor LprI family protein [Pseudomonas sp. BGr12]
MRSMVWLVLATLALGAHASEEDSTPCDNVETDQQNYDCALFSRTTAERELDAAFADLLERIKEQYAGQEAKISDLSKRLNSAETLWKQVRDADCKVETFDLTPGKPFDAALNTCLAQRSDDRSEYLQTLGLQSSD